MDNKYDLIVIGSGIGGLTVASLSSKIFKKKVLVLEKHFKVGGFTHTFKRKNYIWDVGVHYIGDMHDNSVIKKVFDFITDKKLKWSKMPDLFEKFVYPDFTFDVYSNEEKYKLDLIKKFPNEENSIKNYFLDLKKAVNCLTPYFIIGTFSPKIRKFLLPVLLRTSSFYSMTTKEYLNKNFQDEKLKAILTSQWGDYGLTPEYSSFLIHSIIVNHYLNGAYYPIGGSHKIAESIIPNIKNNGGDVFTSHGVKEIIIKNHTAIGVKVEHKIGDKVQEIEFYAPKIISNAGAYNTFKRLIPSNYSKKFIGDLEKLNNQGTSHINLFLGLKESPEKLGFKGENYWVYDSYNHDELVKQIIFSKGDKLNIPLYYLSFPSLKDPEAKYHTAEIIVPINNNSDFQKWFETNWKKRGSDYEALKDSIANFLIDKVNSKYNGFKELVDYQEVSTPLTTEFFTSHKNGNIYGIPATPERYTKSWLGIRTEVKNLYITGTDGGSHGIAGSMMSSVITTGVISGIMPFSLFKVFKGIFKEK